ncbi:hypothetical protein EYF80_050007 [Liparis tanakae]|uniref:Uncharacterized protein n=1 Tax=Liparis tanakae TaxID=230148 RepID=A0A4Z2FF03_9TELE|nr:hypothetical protein EYF80_050007 [Liparis tanakae]
MGLTTPLCGRCGPVGLMLLRPRNETLDAAGSSSYNSQPLTVEPRLRPQKIAPLSRHLIQLAESVWDRYQYRYRSHTSTGTGPIPVQVPVPYQYRYRSHTSTGIGPIPVQVPVHLNIQRGHCHVCPV